MRYVRAKDVKKMIVQQARVSLIGEVGSKARVRRIEGGNLVGASSCFAAQEDERRVD